MIGVWRPISSHPRSVGCRCRRHDSSAAARATLAGTGTVVAPIASAIIRRSRTGSDATLNAPLTGCAIARWNALATSSVWVTWKRSPAIVGSTGTRPGRSSVRGTSRPRKNRVASAAWLRFKINDGRIRTTRISGRALSSTSSIVSTAAF